MSATANMANQIARNFEVMGMDAAAATADHISMFWDPSMKAALLSNPGGLSAHAVSALEQLRLGVPGGHQSAATVFDKSVSGDGSDAG